MQIGIAKAKLEDLRTRIRRDSSRILRGGTILPDLDVEFASVDANDRGVTTKASLALRESPDRKQRTVT